jgi:hypothetical protein
LAIRYFNTKKLGRTSLALAPTSATVFVSSRMRRMSASA